MTPQDRESLNVGLKVLHDEYLYLEAAIKKVTNEKFKADLIQKRDHIIAAGMLIEAAFPLEE